MAGKKLSILNFSAPFANCPTSGAACSYYNFPVNEMNSIRSHGSIPFFSWASQSIPSTVNEPNFQLADVIAGTYDSYIEKWATAARNWGHPFYLRFNWEMNGRWFPWSEGVNGNKSGEFVTAWRHVHDIFTSGRRDQRQLGLVPEHRSRQHLPQPAARSTRATPTSTGPASTATTGAPTRPSPTAGAASTSSTNRPTTRSSTRSPPRSR